MSSTETILYLSDAMEFGGAEQALLALLAHRPRTRRVALVCPDTPGAAPLRAGARAVGADVLAAPLAAGASGRVSRAYSTIRRLRPAIIHANLHWPLACRYELLAAVLARVPAIVVTEHLAIPTPRRRSRWLQRLLATQIDRYIVVSAALGRSLRSDPGLPASKLRVVHNGIDLDRYPYAPLAVGEPPTRLLIPGRLTPQKGQRLMLQALRDLPQLRAIFAGDGPDRVELASLVTAYALGDRVQFTGFRHDLFELFRESDLVVLPSLNEGLPLVVLEAMAVGRPVIASDVGGTAEAICHGSTGLLIPAANVDALTTAIRYLAARPALAAAMGRAGRARAQALFSVTRMVEEVDAVYAEARGS